MIKKVKDIEFETSQVTICYARTGERIYQGPVDDIKPSWVLDYYSDYQIVNKIRDTTYLECTEDTKWWEN